MKRAYSPPLTVSRDALLDDGSDRGFRDTLYLMVLASSRLNACREAFGRAVRLTGSQYAVLIGTAYTQSERGTSIRDLADHVLLAATHVTTEVNRLVRKGILAKRANPLDRRGVLVSLTPRGEHLVDRLAPYLREVNDLLFADVSAREFAALDRFLRRFADNGACALAAITARERRNRRER